MKLTKAQKARAKRAVRNDMRVTLEAGVIGVWGGPWFNDRHPEFAECRRLWRVALAAVAKDGRR